MKAISDFVRNHPWWTTVLVVAVGFYVFSKMRKRGNLSGLLGPSVPADDSNPAAQVDSSMIGGLDRLQSVMNPP